jgi:nucleoside-diphosphate-sugar epimerase
MAKETNICALTGAGGYVGGRIASHLRTAGWSVAGWSRRPGAGGVAFQLRQDVDPKSFAGTRALVHCAYDFGTRTWDDLAVVNVRGSEKLFCAARASGVERIVFISSASAFPGCRSLYGRAKLEIEQRAHAFGAVIIRPGLVWGNEPGGVFGKLADQAGRSRIIPLIGGGRQLQYLVHDADLGTFVARAVAGEIPAEAGPVLLAHEEAWTMRRLMETMAAAHGRRPLLVPVPWRAVWVGLKSLEMLGLPAPFRSDSLVSLIHQNPAPDFSAARCLNATCRRFSMLTKA